MKYRLFAIDLDGTLLTKWKNITKNDLAALKKYALKGGEILINTGKSLNATLPYIYKIQKAIGVNLRYCCCLGGNVIYDIQKKEIIHSATMPVHTCQLIYYACMTNHMHYIAYIKHHGGDKLIFWNRYQRYLPSEAHKINIMASAISLSKMNDLKCMLQQIPNIEILTTHPFFYEIVKKDSNKGSAIKFVCEILGINLKDVACVGDSYNDLPMFKIVGKSFLVKPQNALFTKHVDVFIKQKKDRIAKVINDYFGIKN